MNTASIANRLYDFAKKVASQKQNTQTSEEDLKDIMGILNDIGFGISGINSGKITIWLVDQDGSKIRPEGYLNHSFPFITLDENGNNDEYVTGWLVQTLSRVRGYVNEKQESIISDLKNIINRSFPLEPIPLTNDGDYLIDTTPNTRCIGGLHGYDFQRQRTRDTDGIHSRTAVHKYCRGLFDFRHVTKDKNVLLCSSCGLRILVPTKVKTYGELRKYMKSKLLC